MITMNGIDISNHQGKNNINLDKVLSETKTTFVICKGTEGTTFTDAYLDDFMKIALKHGCCVGIYHYARAERGNSAKAEAEFFFSRFKKWIGKAIPILDWEEKAAAHMTDWVREWLDRVASLTKSIPWFYTYQSMENSNNYSSIAEKYPIWAAKYKDRVADYNYDMSSAGSKPKLKNWDSCVAWQWTSTGRLDGYNGNLDCNIFYGGVKEWQKYITPGDASITAMTFSATNPVQIANSGSDENGRIKGGRAGDQTGREWQIRNWYNRPWNCVLRHPDAEVRAYIATLAIKAAKNNKIGYDQNQRYTFWDELQKVGYDPSKITVPCESDCSAGVIAITKAVGHILNNKELMNLDATYTGNMRSGFKAAGFNVLTASKYTADDGLLLAGDILLNDAHHTAIAVTNGSKSTVTPVKKTEAERMPLVKKGSKGAAVRMLQAYLTGLTIDGEFGSQTEKKVKEFQRKNNLTVDGEVGKNTWNAIINSL